MIDTKDLMSLFDDESLVRKYLQRFIIDMPLLLQKIRNSLEAQQWKALSIQAHSYKCQMQYVHELEAIALAYMLEEISASTNPDTAEIEKIVTELEKRLVISLEEINLIIG